MNTFKQRYAQLNHAQRQAVDTIDGPLLVIAGPGTGKTELLSMRAANILRQTDTLPQNILCLTFTDSGASAMRERLSTIIGPDAYKVAIHTFHSFGTEIINQYGEYFYHGAAFKPADELTSYEILRGIFDELDYTSPLASKMNGEYTHLRDVMTVISELKRSGLASDELLAVLGANDSVLDAIEHELAQLFAARPSTTMLAQLVPLASKVAQLPTQSPSPAYTPLQHTLSLSMAHAFDDAVANNSTKPITAWRDTWLEKNEQGSYVFKNRKRQAKLRVVSHIYYTYLTRMEQSGLYDFDDMILGVIHGLETQPDLRFNLQEKYQYIMVDEFQDTNLAQLRVLFNLTSSPVNEGRPNIMAVGDDDQAIYSFQGAEVNNIHRFREEYPEMQLVVLTDNYRSAEPILAHSREVILQGQQRLEVTMSALGLNKQLTVHATHRPNGVTLHEFSTAIDERVWIAGDIAARIAEGQQPSTIAVLARRHSELMSLLPYMYTKEIATNYERRDNTLDIEVVQAIELLAHIAIHLHAGELDIADSLLPELLAHPAFSTSPEAVWRISLASYRNHLTWLEIMATTPEFIPLQEWLVQLAADVPHVPLEQILDTIIGTPQEVLGDDAAPYVSPLYQHYFGQEQLAAEPERYLVALEALRTIRSHVREYQPSQALHLADFVQYIDMHRQMNIGITSVRRSSELIKNSVHLMTVHKSKGLEFDTVYVIGVHDTAWGERVRSRSRLIGYPENLPLAPAGNNYDERLRLFYVAMTRAKRQLLVSYPSVDDRGASLLPASFLVGTSLTATPHQPATNPNERLEHARTAWHEHYTDHISTPMQDLLAPLLESYKLSATHLNNFVDISRGGPATFLLHNLLRFPQAKSPNASYGTAVHAALQRAHNHLVASGQRRPIEDVLGDFVKELAAQRLNDDDFATLAQKGQDSLGAFLASHYTSFSPKQKTELQFNNQGVELDGARLTGSLDLVEIQDNAITVTDYKTGKASSTWAGRSDYEKIKLHKYKQQLMFYQLLVTHSRDYSKYTYADGVLQFVESNAHGQIHDLSVVASSEELAEFSKLIQAVWHCITSLEFPDASQFEPSYKGMLAFEEHLIDKYIN